MAIQLITEERALEMFDDLLDETNEVVKIAGLTFYPSRILKDCDPIAYGLYATEYYDSLVDDGIYVEGYTEQNYDVRLCPECEEYAVDFRDTICEDCDIQLTTFNNA